MIFLDGFMLALKLIVLMYPFVVYIVAGLAIALICTFIYSFIKGGY